MKLLTATHEGQAERDGDFCDAVEGELVIVGEADAIDQDGGQRVFSGLRSRRATTTAVVRRLDLGREDLELAVAGWLAAVGITAEVIGDLEYAELFIDAVDDMVRFGAAWPENTIVRRSFDGVTIR
jgi:hypothetical protein